MKFETFKALADEANLEITSYSGRCMYGRLCPAIMLERGESEFQLGVKLEAARCVLAEDNPTDFEVDLPTPSSDSMGLDTVIYWTSITLTKEEAKALQVEEDDEDCA
jgi:hypothetical protein